MANIVIDQRDQVVMSLVHYFVTKENYAPILVQGVKDEVWLQNLDGPYKIIRINSNYIHNEEQYEYDMLKVKSILKQIKRKTLSFSINMLNIYVNLAERVEFQEYRHIDAIEIDELTKISTDEILQEAFPGIDKKLIKKNNGLDLIYNVSYEINLKTEKENRVYESVFSPKKIIFTKLIILLCIIMFLMMYVFGNGSNDVLTLVYFGANVGELVKEGQLFRLLTCAFLHIGIIHLIVNMYSLFVVGSQVETYIGKWKFLAIYFISAICGSLMSIVFNSSVSAGASGAIFGLLGALLYFGLHYRLFLGNALVNQIIPIIIINLVIGFMSSGIDNGAHIGGLVAGYLSTMALGIKGKVDTKDRINGSIVLILYVTFLSYMVFFK
jgi:rhomboid protease GluP